MSLGEIFKAVIGACVARISVGKGCEVHGVDLFPQGGGEVVGHLLEKEANGVRKGVSDDGGGCW